MHQIRSALLSFGLTALCACTHPLRLPPDGGGTIPGGRLPGAGGGSEGGGLATVDGATGAGGVANRGGASGSGAANGGDTIGNGGRANAGGTSGGSGGGGTTNAGGSSGKGGATVSGSAAGAGGYSNCQSNPDMISDFESTPGKATLNAGRGRTGYWYVFYPGSDTSASLYGDEAISPALDYSNPITTAPAPDPNACNQFALHSTAKGFSTAGGVGFGAFINSRGPRDVPRSYDVRDYSGIAFKMKSGSGTAPAVFFEVLTKESMPPAAGGVASGPDLNNTRGQLLNAPWSTTEITSTYQTFTVPFATLVPRWLPSPNAGQYRPFAGGVCGSRSALACNAKPFVASDVIGIRFSVYLDDEFPKPEGSTSGGYDLWVDDVAFVKGDAGLRTRKGFPLANPGSFGKCDLPRGPSAAAKLLVLAYDQWKATFVQNDKVIRPESRNDVVSEGIAFGMLIALNMNDQPLFDGLHTTWKGSPAAGASTLMKSCLGGSGGATGTACTPSDGSSTGADQDVAYALLMADRLWGGTYKANAIAMLKEIWDKDIDGTGTKLPKGGSQFEAPTGTEPRQMTSASYFAPSYYRAFATVDPDTAHDWLGVVAAVYEVMKGPITGSNGLIPAWCGKKCTVAATNGSGGDIYQYDSHRIPMRVGLDYCFNGAAEAKTYADRITAFVAAMGRYGVGYVSDLYNTQGGEACCEQTTNSASMLGTAAVGAMASGKEQTFLDEAYQVVFDVATRGTLAPALIPPYQSADYRQPTYGYYNATMAMLTLLIMTGNFMH